MSERPILMSGPMVRACLLDAKGQTRRVVTGEALRFLEQFLPQYVADLANHLSPYGYAGDRLWVRETGWERPERTGRMMREGADTWRPYEYDADGLTEADHEQFKAWGWRRRPAIHMPRTACRLVLDVTAVRIERLQDITEADAKAEGCEPRDAGGGNFGPIKTYRTGFVHLWNSLNKGRGFGWLENPWVWVVSFKRAATDLKAAA